MGTQSANASGSRSVARWRRIRTLVSIVGIALLSGVVDHGWARKADAGTAPVHDVAVVPLDDGFEAGTTLSGGFCVFCEHVFQPVTSDAHTGSHALFAPDSASAGYVSVNGAPVVIPENASAAELTFWQRFEFEHNDSFNFDGGVLELATDELDPSWIDVGPDITAGGYNGTIEQRGGGNPLEGRAAWVGDSSGWHQVTVDLMAYRGHRLMFQLKMGTDSSNGSPVGGWWVDDFRVMYRAPLSACSHAWTALTPHPTGVQMAFVAGIGANLYAFGGILDDELSAAAWRYSTDNDSWDPIASLPEARIGASAVSDGRYIYILGGKASLHGSPTSTLRRYDPVANSYVTLAPFATATTRQAAVYLDGTIYKIAGQTDDDGHAFAKAVEAYSVANDSWSAVADFPEGLGDLTAVAIDGHIYTAGGHLYFFSRADTYRYDVTSNTWTPPRSPICKRPRPAPAEYCTTAPGSCSPTTSPSGGIHAPTSGAASTRLRSSSSSLRQR